MITNELAEALNNIIGHVARRAEMADPEHLEKTFVEVEQITAGLRSIDHGVLYGRRGTGKTHSFTHLSQELDGNGTLAVLLDLRRIGSNGGLYSDQSEAFSLRASQLLIDVIEEIHERLLRTAIEDRRFSGLLESLDDLAEAATDIRVDGPVERVTEDEAERAGHAQRGWELGLGTSGGSLKGGTSKATTRADRRKQSERRAGVELPQLRFGRLSRAMEKITLAVKPARLWLLLDEWSSLPLDLQPVLADMLKRVFFTTPGLTVKIGAIERRSRFVQRKSNSNYIGIELGADTGATLNLDEHLVNVDDLEPAARFYENLLQKHLKVTAAEHDLSWSVQVSDVKRYMFEDEAFLWLVRAAEGVPRDAINILGLAAGYARDRKITGIDVRNAARMYYLQDKETGIIGNNAAQKMWDKLQREVVSRKRSRMFLLRRSREQTTPAILDLYDARLIHLLKPGLCAAAKPGVVYDGYAVDFGSYVSVLEELEIRVAWRKAKYPWEQSEREGQAFLPERFNEEVVFNPRNSKIT